MVVLFFSLYSYGMDECAESKRKFGDQISRILLDKRENIEAICNEVYHEEDIKALSSCYHQSKSIANAMHIDPKTMRSIFTDTVISHLADVEPGSDSYRKQQFTALFEPKIKTILDREDSLAIFNAL